jgi:hypothetical protein
MLHELKTWPEFFQPTLDGVKRFELRRDDRPEGFQVGDELLLKEWVPGNGAHQNPGYTGREIMVRVDYIMPAKRVNEITGGYAPEHGNGFVIMSISKI